MLGMMRTLGVQLTVVLECVSSCLSSPISWRGGRPGFALASSLSPLLVLD
jgi:hypothetical protein